MSSPGQGSRAPAGADVGATLREMWATRPARLKSDRKVAGVAAAISRRYAIDPTLVRVAFVVGLFYGVGLLVYLAGILLLPRVDERGRRETPVWAIVIGSLLGIAAVASAFSGDLGTVIGVVTALGLLYALHRSRGHLRDPQRPTPVADGGVTSEGETAASPQPPSWDPLGAAPFAWDLPEPAAPPAPRPPRSRVGPVTLGVALLAVGAVAGLGLLGVVPLGVTALAATALAVVGVGLVVAAFRRRGRGLIVAAVPLALLVVAAANAPANGPWRDGWRGGPPWAVDGPGTVQTLGDASWSPAPNAVAPAYETAFGDARLDLRGLATVPPGAPPVRTQVQSGAGDVTVLLPANADVTAACESGGGDVDCLGRPGGGGRMTDPGPDGPGGPIIDLQARSGGGDVEVRRG
jgi:phage shock protein PspC (stress-responsive transcriptional regulator)